MDDLEISKIVGVGCAAMLAFVGLTEVSGGLLAMHKLDEPAYTIEVADDAGGEAGAEATPIADLIAAADLEAGAKAFKGKCSSCHTSEDGGANKVGPNLHGIMGRDIASVGGFGYSGALEEKEGAWDWEAMNAFLAKPGDWAPGTKMSFAGFRKETDRANVMAWLNQQSSAPIDPPAE